MTLPLPLLARGKVRELYAVGDDLVLIVASDRISAYDLVLPTEIPDKGAVLTGLTLWWLDRLADVVPHHLVAADDPRIPAEVRGRSMLCRRLAMVPVECVARGYLAGSGWADYAATGSVCGVELPAGLREGDRLPATVFTPATKAAEGHDQNVSAVDAAALVGVELVAELSRLTRAVYNRAAEIAAERGILLADTKLEFGHGADGVLTLGDEVLTPDSSRFWPADGYEAGHGQPSYDKQFVRDWASGTGWDKTPPAPEVPAEIVDRTRALYVEAYEKITGEPFQAWLERTTA